MDIVGNSAKIFQRRIQQLLEVYNDHKLDAGNGFLPMFIGLSCFNEPQLSGGTARFLLLYDTIF